MPLFAFHIHLDLRFLILESLIIFLVIRIFFSPLTITSPLPMITLANGSQTMVEGIGSACPIPSIPVTYVLYVPDSPFNLIFISKLTRDLNCLITFSNNFVTLQDRSTGRTIGIGREFQGLFHLNSSSSFTACTSMDTPLLIHNLLGHPNISKFRVMVPRFSSLSSIECESRQLGKHTRVPIPKSLDQRTKSSFELVHTNVWGPSRTEFTLGFWYFVTFIDDYSRCTWLFLMKTRVELFSIFQKFYAKVRTQFNTSIHILLSDNAKEYLFGPFTSFWSSHGICHQSSYAYTPQQNEVAKRKTCHLVETACTFLLYHKVPQRFWGDATLAACYLIDRMLSSVLHDKISHSILFPNQPLFCLPPRVFGCICFVHILTPTRSSRNPHPIYNFLTYHHLSSPYSAFVSTLSSVSVPQTGHEALSHPS